MKKTTPKPPRTRAQTRPTPALYAALVVAFREHRSIRKAALAVGISRTMARRALKQGWGDGMPPIQLRLAGALVHIPAARAAREEAACAAPERPWEAELAVAADIRRQTATEALLCCYHLETAMSVVGDLGACLELARPALLRAATWLARDPDVEPAAAIRMYSTLVRTQREAADVARRALELERLRIGSPLAEPVRGSAAPDLSGLSMEELYLVCRRSRQDAERDEASIWRGLCQESRAALRADGAELVERQPTVTL